MYGAAVSDPKKYPLAAAEAVSRMRVGEAEAALGRAEAAVKEAHVRLDRAREVARAHAAETKAKTDEALEAPHLGGPDATQLGQYQRRRQQEAQGLEARITEAEAALAAAARAREAAHAALVEERQKGRVVEKHREQWQDREQKALERREDDVMDEAAVTRRRGT